MLEKFEFRNLVQMYYWTMITLVFQDVISTDENGKMKKCDNLTQLS